MGHRHIWLWFLAMVPDIYSRAYFRAALGQPAGLQGWLGSWAFLACIGLYTRPHCIFKSINNVDRSLSCITELFRSITDLFFEVVCITFEALEHTFKEVHDNHVVTILDLCLF